MEKLYSSNVLLQVKSKYLAEFRRFPTEIKNGNFGLFLDTITSLHQVKSEDIVLTYTDPIHGDLLPINNDENFVKAKQSCKRGILRIYIHEKDNYQVSNGFGQSTISISKKSKRQQPLISLPEDFRPVSAIIDVDILPETLRRVRLHNHGANKPLGFFIRDGKSLRMSDDGVEKIPGIFISRLVQGGLAEMTGLLAVNDEVLEVNGIEVANKSLDQVTDMMVANSSNLIITVKPASMRNIAESTRLKVSERSPLSSVLQNFEMENIQEEEDTVKDLVEPSLNNAIEFHSHEDASVVLKSDILGSSDTDSFKGSLPILRRSSEVMSSSSRSSLSSVRSSQNLKKRNNKNVSSFIADNGVVNL